MDLVLLAYYVLAIIVVLFLVKIIFKSMSMVWKVLINALVGGAILWILNIFGLGIVISWVTALIVGFLGVPGVIVVLLLQFVFRII